ncbi:hypothetical protein [Variovorax paradoxus]|uniref:hypothetical protein n=1 Tax=Variovorax paradoxus TaxID=34073 RepID=UPI002788BC1C|nr:hypothetical protein [Variovorax paradoxus]MDP9932886.1 hypothetical protein [Variovorax paradoxus]
MSGFRPEEYDLIAPFFDRSFYLSSYAEVAAASIDPIEHYCTRGWKEGRNPNTSFDTLYYLRENRDVAAAGINPFFHFVGSGRHEGRRPVPEMNVVRQRVSDAWSTAAALSRSAKDVEPVLGAPVELDADAMVGMLVSCSEHDQVVISVSHDDYATSAGGIQNIIGDECKAFRARGVGYLHLCPVRPMRGLADASAEDFSFALRLDGMAIGRTSGLALRQALTRLANAGVRSTWVLHHLMGHSPELLRTLVEANSSCAPLFWIHDYFSACPSYTLLRNDVTYCGMPAADSDACRICAYGQARPGHQARIQQLLHSIQPELVAPSQTALELWARAGLFETPHMHVLQPAKLLPSGRPRHSRSGRLRVAYLGSQVFHKGWYSYQRLAAAFRADDRYEFLQFGSPGPTPSFIRHVPVKVGASARDAMVRAIAAQGIDVVISWSVWPETFCFTAHEAIAGGAFLVVKRGQGHVNAAVHRYAPQASRSIEDEEELHRYFHAGGISTDVEQSPLRYGYLLPSQGSAELLHTTACEGDQA